MSRVEPGRVGGAPVVPLRAEDDGIYGARALSDLLPERLSLPRERLRQFRVERIRPRPLGSTVPPHLPSVPPPSVCRFRLTRKRLTGLREFVQPRASPETDQPEHPRRRTLLKSSHPSTEVPRSRRGTCDAPVRSLCSTVRRIAVALHERGQLKVS